MPEAQTSTCYEFGGYLLDPHQRRLVTVPRNEPVQLAPRVFDTLAYLVERPGELVDKAVLLDALWPDSVADENSLNQNISILRRVLGERPTEHRFIVTVPGRGYRFVASVQHVARPALETRPRASVAVLPFANLSGSAANDYLGEGLADELIHQLAKLPGLRVSARTTSFACGRRIFDIRQIARELGVRAVLEGAVHMVAERIRVTVQLIEGDTGYHLFSRSVERKAQDLFYVEDELVNEVARALGIDARVTPRTARDVAAHHQYMQARTLATLPSEDNLRGSLELLKQATARDPEFVRAWSLLAAVLAICVEYDYPMADAIARAEQAARRSTALDPNDGASLAAVGVVQALRGQWVDAEVQFRAATLLPVDLYLINLRCVFVTQAAGHLQRSLAEAFEAYQFAGAQGFGAVMVALTHLLLGHDQEVLSWADAAVALGESPTVTPQADLRAQLAHRAGRHSDAAVWLIDSTPPAICAAGAAEAIRLMCSALAGEAPKRDAVVALQAMEARLWVQGMDQTRHKRLLLWYTMLGDLDAAYDMLQRALDYYIGNGFVGSVWGWLWLPELRPFRRDARFQSFVRRLGLMPYWERYGPPDGHDLSAGILICS
jgi:TolB-like protein